jgi:ABC-2 type transport system ATP-binding protein
MIGYMPQKFGLYEELSVIQNLSLYADLRGIFKDSQQEIFKKLLNFTGLNPFTDRLAGNLSGGMKQKLGLACALVKNPPLLLLDEPSVGVDPISRRELWKMVHALLDDGISVLWSTAYLDEAEKCHSVLLLNEGKLLYNGPPNALTEQVKGRTFIVKETEENRRKALQALLIDPSIEDGLIQGSNIRVLCHKNCLPPSSAVPVPPRFEDAFIDILGGGPGGISRLADHISNPIERKKVVIEAKNLIKDFGSFRAVDNISFQVGSGEIFGLLGPNGAGKSTTFKMMCGLLKPTHGEAFVNGLDLQTAPSQARSRIGYMAQKFSLYGNLSVKQNLQFFSGVYNLKGALRKQIIDEMIEIFSLSSYLNESADLLPLGFKQRLALACSVLHQPDVLFLDEPTSGVDPIIRREFWNHINGVVEKGVTVIVTTHFMDEAESCDRIGLVYRSQLIETGTPEELKAMAATSECPFPTLEEAFIQIIERYDAK